MKNTLANDLEASLGFLFPAMISHDWLSILRQTACILPPFGNTLLECRLSAGQPQVDISQFFLMNDRPVLNFFLQSPRICDKKWESIRALITQWSKKGTPVEIHLNGIWLEFDLSSDQKGQLAAPSLFLSMDPKAFRNFRDSKLKNTLEHFFILILGMDRYQEYFSAYLSCLKKLPSNASPNYIGFMLSRKTVSVRALFKGINKNQIEDYLKNIGLKRFPESFQNMIDIAYRFFHSNVLGIDLTPVVSSRIGFELFPNQYILESPFDGFLDALVKTGLCTELKRKAIESWPDQTDPATSEAGWPDHLILQSLKKPTDFFSIIRRRINHFKLVCQNGTGIEAKAYLAFDHWARLGAG